MAREKRVKSKVVPVLEKRISGLASIDKTLDMGDGISVANLTAHRDSLTTKTKAYNDLLTASDKALNEIGTVEKASIDLCKRTLKKVEGKYGDDSSEYEQVGGARRSERKKGKKKTSKA